jgi:UDPglucose 6-dehydrogenase
MKVSIIGTGYVGLVTGACLADVGNQVLCLDVDQRKIARLKAGEIPIYEPGLEDIVRSNVAGGRLAFTTDPAEAARYAKLQMIAVGTPPGEDGSADLQYVIAPNSTPILVGRGSLEAGPMSVPFPVRAGMTCWSSPSRSR